MAPIVWIKVAAVSVQSNAIACSSNLNFNMMEELYGFCFL